MAKASVHSSRPIAVDLFCGAGGMSLGFEQAGFDPLIGVDVDGYHAATHHRNFPFAKTLCRSVADLTAAEVVAALGGRTDIDVVYGGPPCQGFSSMGLRNAGDPRNSLVGHFVRLIIELRPKAFVMENVPGMLAGATKAVLDDLMATLTKAGYRIEQPVRVLDASDFGVPQKRRRLIVLGLRADIVGSFGYPKSAPPGSPARPTVLEAIADLPDVDADDKLFTHNDAKYTAAPQSDYARVMRGVVADPSDYSHPRSWDRGRCTGCLRVRHSDAAVALYKATLPGRMVPSHKLPRLDPNGIAPTLRAGSDSSRGAHTAPRPIHPLRPRCITAREAARLHGYPDWFSLYPLKWHAYRQIGNSVCPPLARAIGSILLAALGRTPVKPIVSIALNDEFTLPDERPRSHKRSTHNDNFTPVIAALFADRYDVARKTLTDSRFSFADVSEAIGRTGVQLGWVRGDNFIRELTRIRSVRAILQPCLSLGYTIRGCDDADAIGEFVPATAGEGIEAKRATVDI